MDWGHGYDFTSSVSHPRLDSVGLLVYDGMWQCLGHQYYTTSPLGQCQPYQEGVKGLDRPYGRMIWLNDYIYIYIKQDLSALKE
jgi:hypothetical protein